MWAVIIVSVLFALYFLRLLPLAGLVLKRPKGFPPGPLALPLVGNLPLILYHGSLHKTFQSLIPKYGPIFSVFIGPTRIVVLNSIDAYKETGKLDEFQGRPDIPLFTLWDDTGNGYVGGVGMNDGPVHAEQRKCLVKILHQLSDSTENVFMEEFTSLIEHLRSLVGQPINIRQYLRETVETILRKNLVGIPNEDIETVRQYKKVVLAPGAGFVGRPITTFFTTFFTEIAQSFPTLSGYNLMKKENEDSNKLLRKIVHTYQSMGASNKKENKSGFIPSFLDQIEKTADKHSSLYGETGLRNLAIVIKDLTAGGGDGVPEQTTWFILYLICHPNVKGRIVEEIREVVGFSRAPTKNDFNSMHYTQATLQEVMRLSSLSAFGLLNKTLETITFHGFLIPKGTMVIRNSHAAHHEQNYWGDPENFRPERFLDQEGKFRRDKNIFTFGSGRRICVGESQAKFGMLFFITLFLQNFELSPDSSKPTPTLEPLESLALAAKPYRIVLHKRKRLAFQDE